MDFFHAAKESLGIVFADGAAARARAPAAAAAPRASRSASSSRQQRLTPSSQIATATPAAAIAGDRRRATQRERHGQGPGRRVHAQHRLDLARRVHRRGTGPIRRETAGPHSCDMRNAASRQSASSRSRKSPVSALAIQPTGQAVGFEAQAGAVGDQQQVPARKRIAASHALQQQRVARGIGAMQRQEIDARPAIRARGSSRTARSAQSRLNTRVPLVPPKPKPLDMATSIFFCRATLGTKSRSQPSPGLSRLMVGGMTP